MDSPGEGSEGFQNGTDGKDEDPFEAAAQFLEAALVESAAISMINCCVSLGMHNELTV